MLIDLARNGDDIDLRKRAVYALSRAKSEKGQLTLREIAADSKAPEELRMEAFGWYLRSAQPNNADPLPFLKTMYASVNSDGMKQAVLRSVAGVRSEEARSFLSGLAINDRESLDVRRSAVLYLERLGGLSVVVRTSGGRDSTPSTAASRSAEFALIAKSLWQVWEKTDELEIRRQVLSSLARVGDNAGIDKLIDVARNEKNTELRRSAISYLSRSKDPRAIELLQEIINK
jgi:HEAT repeat protein